MEPTAGNDKEQRKESCPSELRGATPPERAETSTWNFVQMNMTLLPIARPLPVTICHRFQEGAALAGAKPRTPTQKLHHRLRQNSSNISPRRHDLDSSSLAGLRRATPTTPRSSEPLGRPPTPRSACGGKRKCPDAWHVPSIITAGLPAVNLSEEAMRVRSFSEDHSRLQPGQRGDSGYFSDPMVDSGYPAIGHSPLQRSASLSSGCATSGLFKGKRILELQDEDRRLHPDERVTAPSPSKRSRHQK